MTKDTTVGLFFGAMDEDNMFCFANKYVPGQSLRSG